MGRPRAFDWDEAARLYARLGTHTAVADTLGISAMSVRRALDPKARAHQAEYQRCKRAWIGTCGDCGGPATNAYASRRHTVCQECRAKRQTTTARPDALRCSLCRLWLPDEAFPLRSAANGRRGRHAHCRLCLTVAKRLYRQEHPENERAAYERRKVRRRAASHTASGELS